MLTIAQAMQIAVQHHAAGRLPQAEQYCRQVLRADPEHAGAMHLLGLLAYQVGRSDLAINSISGHCATNRTMPKRITAWEWHGQSKGN